jgi:hypothetical protein
MNRNWLAVIALVLFLAGLLVVFGSVTLGSQAANAYLRAQGGGMDSAQFMIVFQEYIRIYSWIGAILSVAGGLGLLKTIPTY